MVPLLMEYIMVQTQIETLKWLGLEILTRRVKWMVVNQQPGIVIC